MHASALVRFGLAFVLLATVAHPSTPRPRQTRESDGPSRFNPPAGLGIVAFSSAAEISLLMPLNKSEAVAAAGLNFQQVSPRQLGTPILLGAMGGGPGVAAGTAVAASLPVVVPVVSGLTAAFQAAHGRLAAPAEAELAPARTQLARTLHGTRLEFRLQDRFLADLHRELSPTIVVVEESLLRRTDPDLAARAWRNDVELRRATRAALLQRNLPTILEIRVHAPSLLGASPLDPRLALSVQVRIRLVDTATGRELHRAELQYRGAARPYREWAAADSALLREEIDRCVATLGDAGTPGIVAHSVPRIPPGRLLAASAQTSSAR